MKAQAEAEAAASAADAAARQAQTIAQSHPSTPADSSRQQALREAGRASQIASAERVEAARRAEAAAMAEAAARREEREIAEANASARRQAARYADSEIRNRESGVHAAYTVPGEISDPYVPHPHLQSQPLPQERAYERPALQRQRPGADDVSTSLQPIVEYHEAGAPAVAQRMEQPAAAPVVAPAAPAVEQTAMPTATRTSSGSGAAHRGYRPDDASGVRQIYRGPEFDEPSGEYAWRRRPVRAAGSAYSQITLAHQSRHEAQYVEPVTGVVPGAVAPTEPQAQAGWPFSTGERFDADFFDARKVARSGSSQRVSVLLRRASRCSEHLSLCALLRQ